MKRAPIRVHRNEATPWIRIADTQPEGEGLSAEYLASTYRVHELGSEDSPQLLEADYAPGVTIGVHAHDHDEIVYVLRGAMLVGQQALGPGSSLFVAANTLYSFRAGPDGLHFLNFRPVRDDSHLTSSDFLARRAATKAAG